jgi:autotransporter-associated beta strand protein
MTVTAAGGTVNMANFASTSTLGTLQLTGDLHVIGNNTFTLANATTNAPAVVQGHGTLYVNTAGGGMQISSNSNAYTGAVVIDQSEFGLGSVSSAGVLTLTTLPFTGSPLMGSLNGAASYDVRAGGTMQLNSNVSNSFQNGDRISDTAPIRLRGGNITLNGPAAAGTNGYTPQNLTENAGDMSGAGFNVISALPVASTNVTTTFQPNSLMRLDHGTFVFRGTALGDGATATRGRVMLTNPLPVSAYVGGLGVAGTQNISILPYAVGGISSSDTGSSFVTYGGDGFRLLTNAEYITDNLAPSDPTSNVRLTAVNTNNVTGTGQGFNAPTMNALLLSKNGSSDGSVAGTGTLNITSGAILANGGNAASANPDTISNNVHFGSWDLGGNELPAEGIITTNAFNGLRITGQLFGSMGLTRTGSNGSSSNNVLVLSADNSGLTGPLTLNAGQTQYNADNALPGTGQIVVNGAGVSSSAGLGVALVWAGANPTTLTRDVAVNTGTLNFRINDFTAATVGNLGNMHLQGTISGTGNVSLQPQVAGSSVTVPGDIYIDNPANTYTGVTRFAGGNTHIATDGSTGVGGMWEFAGGSLIAEGNITNSRPVNFEGNTLIDTKANNVTLNGPITSFGATWGSITTNAGLTKNGVGTLTFTNTTNTLAGTVTVNAGALLINGNLGPSNTNNVVVNPGATLGGVGTLYRNVVGFSTLATGGSTKGGGTISPGLSADVGTPGIMTIWGSLNLANTIANGGPACTLKMDLDGPIAGTGYDQIQTLMQNALSTTGPGTAQVLLGGAESPTPTTQAANLSLSLGYAPAATDVFWIITNSNKYQDNLTADATHFRNITTGTFAGLPEGSVVELGTFGDNTYFGTISYKGDFDSNNPMAGTGNDVVIYNIVPAPGSIALLGIGGLLAARRKRRTA